MRLIARTSKAAAVAAVMLVFIAGAGAASGPALTQISSDPLAGGGQHRSEGEPDLAANGSTLVSAFQVGRYDAGGGSQAVGWATSTDGGASWVHGLLPGVTAAASGPYARTADNTVDYDVTHGSWLISSLGINPTANGHFRNAALVVSRSPDGTKWSAPAIVDSSFQPDKGWLRCDNWPSSPFRGTCYLAYSYLDRGVMLAISHTTDGGVTWSPAATTPSHGSGYNAQVVIQPNGNVVVTATAKNNLIAIRSTDGGRTWTNPTVAAPMHWHETTGGVAVEGAKPSVRVDGQGTIYAVWSDCRFRQSCRSNDLVISTSTDGLVWSPVQRIPIDAVSTEADHFLPGLGVDPTTAGPSARIGVVFYYYLHASCATPCRELTAGFISSSNGGGTWGKAIALTPSFNPAYAARAHADYFLGDYFSTVFVSGRPVTVIAYAKPPSGGLLDEAMYLSKPAATSNRIVATVTASGAVSVTPRSGTAGTYTVSVRDRSRRSGFHLKGPGVNRSTTRPFTGTATWHITLTSGTYRYFTDGPKKHAGTIRIR